MRPGVTKSDAATRTDTVLAQAMRTRGGVGDGTDVASVMDRGPAPCRQLATSAALCKHAGMHPDRLTAEITGRCTRLV
jgi:hypothetical protein